MSLFESITACREKLLDLTSHNRLLNFTASKGKSIQFVATGTEKLLSQMIEEGTEGQFRILGLPEPKSADLDRSSGQPKKPDAKSWATQHRISTSYELEYDAQTQANALQTILYAEDIARLCRKIDRESKLCEQEIGQANLYLIFGYLHYQDNAEGRNLIAPLVSIPVKLTASGQAGVQTYSLSYTGDDLHDNISLRLKFKKQFGIILPDFPEDLSSLWMYFRAVESALFSQPTFRITNNLTLSLLSFTSMIQYIDTDPERWEGLVEATPENPSGNALTGHTVIQQVIGTVYSEAEEHTVPIAPIHDVETPTADALPMVFDADPSQHSAVIDAVVHGKSMVVIGPPGTGKSQTIANMIASFLHAGKRVLFVAEKLAALNVVHTRLSKSGLSPFLLELHSNKTQKRDVIRGIDERDKMVPPPVPNIQELIASVSNARAELKQYVHLINSVSGNRLGKTVQQLIGKAETARLKLGDHELTAQALPVRGAQHLTEEHFHNAGRILSNLQTAFTDIGAFNELSPYYGFYPKSLGPGDDIRIQKIITEFLDGADHAKIVFDQLYQLLGPHHTDYNQAAISEAKKHLTIWYEKYSAAPDLPFELTRKIVDTPRWQLDLISRLEQFEQTRKIAIGTQTGNGFVPEYEITQEDLDNVNELLELLSPVADGTCTIYDLVNLTSTTKLAYLELIRSANLVSTLLANLVYFTIPTSRIDFVEKRVRLSNLFTPLLDIPGEALVRFIPALASSQVLDMMSEVQALGESIEQDRRLLSEHLYLDTQPVFDHLSRAISTLRQGDAWYRFFQSSWRSAIRLHRSLHKSPTLNISSDQRLRDLTNLEQLTARLALYRAHPVWHALKRSPPTDIVSLIPEIELSKRMMRLRQFFASENIGYSEELFQNQASLQDARLKAQSFTTSLNELESKWERTITSSRLLQNTSRIKSITDLNDWLAVVFRDAPDRLLRIEKAATPTATLNDLKEHAAGYIQGRAATVAIQSNQFVKDLLGTYFKGLDTKVEPVMRVVEALKTLHTLPLRSPIISYTINSNALVQSRTLLDLCDTAEAAMTRIRNFNEQMQSFGTFFLIDFCKLLTPISGISLESLGTNNPERIRERSDEFIAQRPHAIVDSFAALKAQKLDYSGLVAWSRYCVIKVEAMQSGFIPWIQALQRNTLPNGSIAHAYFYSAYCEMVKSAFSSNPRLNAFMGMKHEQIRADFQKLDRKLIELRGQHVAAHCIKHHKSVPGRNASTVSGKTEMALIRHLATQSRPRVSLRQVLERAPMSIQSLKPVFMMGPAAVAHYLAPGKMHFDVVIMDEASQMRPEEALGSIARGTQLIVVGDPKQLPPSSFFQSISQSHEGEQFGATDAESILNLCQAAFSPLHMLRFHYRSRHPSLCDFSNRNFYDSRLLVFPSPHEQGAEYGLQTIYLKDSIYEQQTNRAEANRIVSLIFEHLASRPNETLGVVTLNIKQADLITDLFEAQLIYEDVARETLSKWDASLEGLFIKSLENVQGDERDRIIISTTFGKAPGTTVVKQNFGPISRQGGWRRLNVLVTRARKSICLVTSMRPEDIIIGSDTPEGTRALRAYLEFARDGAQVSAKHTGKEPDSDFEMAVIESIRQMGFEAEPQLGVSTYRIDIAVKHPQYPSNFIAAIECDGATYHSALSARDRDRIRQEIIESLGWKGKIYRIWSTDWFRSPRHEASRLKSFLESQVSRFDQSTAHQGQRSHWIEESINNEADSDELKANNSSAPSSAAGAVEHDPLSPPKSRSGQTFNSEQNNFTTAIQPIDVQGVALTRDAQLELPLETTDEDNFLIQPGDTVKYHPVDNPSELKIMQIVTGKDDLTQGIINEARPLAQAFLDAQAGDHVTLDVPGHSAKVFKVLSIHRN